MRNTLAIIISTIVMAFNMNAQTLEEYQKLGESQMNEGNNAEALENFKKAIALDQTTDGNSIVYSYAGLCAKNMGNDAAAKGFFTTAIERGFEEPVIFTLLGEICRNEGDVDCQEKTYRKAMDIFPSEQKEFGKKLAYVYYNAKMFEKLEPLTDELLREDPNNEKMMQFNAVSLQKQKKTEEAKAVYEKVLKLNPENLSANVFLGNYYYQVGKSKLDREEKKYEAISNPDRVMWSNYQKKTKLIKDEFYTQAVDYLEKAYAIKAQPSLKKMLYAAYFKLGNKEKAELYKE